MRLDATFVAKISQEAKQLSYHMDGKALSPKYDQNSAKLNKKYTEEI